jgi:hypothetical protein
MSRDVSRLWLSTALGVSALLIVGAPFVGQVSVWLRDVARGHYSTVLAAIVVSTATLAVVAAASQIRDRRAFRYGMLAAAVLIATAYARFSASGVADVDAAERFHIIEYGLVAVLFYKAVQAAGDTSVLIIPIVAGFVVGTLEEWLQWFVPGRVGEARDVLLNLIAVGCGLLFSLGLDPPHDLRFEPFPKSRRRLAALSVIAVMTFAGFFQSVHLGYDVVDPDAGVFRSRYSAGELAELSRARSAAWQTTPPMTQARLAREDQYLTEGIAHIRRRNERWSEGNLLAARHENLILERYFAPVLDTASYLSATPNRWPPEQRAQAETQSSGSPPFMIYDSDALPYPIYTWPRWLYWLVVAGVASAVLRAVNPRA